jgi:signal peptidase I
MKKSLIALLIFCGTVITLWIAARLTGALQTYKIATPANEPTLKVGQSVFISNLKDCSRGKFIAYTNKYLDSLIATFMENPKPGANYLYRLCAIPGDLIEMKNGILFVNGQNFDEELNLKNQFKLSTKEYDAVIEEEDKPTNDYDVRPSDDKDSLLVSLDRGIVKKYQSKLKFTPYLLTDTVQGPFKWFDKNSTWTADNFGPLKIPAGNYFGLGDNRHNALDSRYTGFIKKDNIKGVVLNK